MGSESSLVAVVEQVAAEMERAGMRRSQISTWKFQQLAIFTPKYKSIYESAIVELGLLSVVPEKPANPTEVGKQLGERRDDKAVSARTVNRYLVEAGLQTIEYRDSSSGKKKPEYRLTELGKQYGVVEQAPARNSQGSVYMVRWYSLVVEFLNSWINARGEEQRAA